MSKSSIDDFLSDGTSLKADLHIKPINMGRFVRHSRELDSYLGSLQSFLGNEDGIVKVGDHIIEGYEVRKPLLGCFGKCCGIEKVVPLNETNLTMDVVVDAFREKLNDGISSLNEASDRTYKLIERRELYGSYLFETVEQSCGKMQGYVSERADAISLIEKTKTYLSKVCEELDSSKDIYDNTKRKIGLETKLQKLVGEVDLLDRKDSVEMQFIQQSNDRLSRVTEENSQLGIIAYGSEVIVEYSKRMMRQVDTDYDSLQVLGSIFSDLSSMMRTSSDLSGTASAFQKAVSKHITPYAGGVLQQ